jgi:PRTRC genetic system protein C
MRVFVYDGREFPDPDPEADVEEVKKRMADFFPELANAEVKEAARGEDTLYEFVRKVGTKG